MKLTHVPPSKRFVVAATTCGTALVVGVLHYVEPEMFQAHDIVTMPLVAFATACAWAWWQAGRQLRRELAKRARELAQSEEQHRLLLEQASDAILVADAATGRIVEANRCACDLLGWRVEELVGQHHGVLHTPEDRAGIERVFAADVEPGEVWDDELAVRHRGGEAMRVQVRSSLIEAGAHRYVQAIMRDLRPRLLAEEALRRSEARLRGVFERAPVAILEEDFSAVGAWLQTLRQEGITDLAGYLQAHPQALSEQFARVKVTSANPAALRAAGAPDLETYHRKSMLAISPEGLKAFQLELEAIWQGRAEVVCEVPFRRVDGTAGHSVLHWSVTEADGCFDLSRVVVVFSDLSELRAAEARLREIEDRWELAVRALNVGIFEKNYARNEVYLSDRWKEMLGFEPHELPGRASEWQARIHPDDHDRVIALLQSHLRGENDFYRTEYRMLCKNGEYKWIDARGRAFFDRAGHPLRLIGAHTDISERKQAEAALRESERRYRQMFEHSPVAIVEHDYRAIGAWLTGLRARGVTDLSEFLDEHPDELARAVEQVVVVGVNEEMVRLAGARSKQELFENLPRVFTADLLRARREAFLALWDGRNEIEGEIAVRDLDGVERRVYYRWWLPLLASETGYEWTQLVLVDLTEIRSAEAALAQERERLRVTLRAMAEGLITTDTMGVVQFMNEAAERLTGWTAGAAVGRGVEQVCVLRHEKTRADVNMPVARAISEHCVVDFPLQSILVGRQGTSLVVDGRCAPMHDLAGHALGAVIVFRDVTERARLEAELLRSSKLESIGILAGGIAHDFNNILTVVMGNVTLAMLDSGVMAAAGRWLGEAERGVMRARDLTQQLLTFAKGGEPVRKTVQLQEVAREAAEFGLHGSKVRCEFHFDPELWAANVDAGQIGQVVQNLVINAVQAMPEGGLIRISMANETVADDSPRALAAGSYLHLSIADAGVGIRAEHLSRIFDPYFTTKQSGSGLGLATVYSIVRRHQGHIDVESELGRGTVFHIWLPAVPHVVPSAPEAPSKISGMGGRVLFMDDEPTICTMAKTLLSRLGFEVVTVSDGASVIDAYKEARSEGRPFNVVMMDLTVPGGMGGREAMEALLKIDPQVRAIVSSGYSSDPVLANYRAHGFRGMVAKPYKFSDLARTLQAVLHMPD